jgi:hypothetical protein
MLIKLVMIYMFLMGIAIILITGAILFRKNIDAVNIFSAGKNSNASKFSSVILQILTAAGMIAGTIGLYRGINWGVSVSLFSLVALVYISLKGLTWNSENRWDILRYVAFAGSAAGIVILLVIYK